MLNSDFSSAEALLAADIVQLEQQLDVATREAALWRDMALEALAMLHSAILHVHHLSATKARS